MILILQKVKNANVGTLLKVLNLKHYLLFSQFSRHDIRKHGGHLPGTTALQRGAAAEDGEVLRGGMQGLLA